MTEAYVPKRFFNRFFLLIWVEAFGLQMGQNIFNNLISVYAVSLGYSNTLAGSLAIPYMVLAVLGRFLSGDLADNRSRRSGMVLGCAAFTIGAAAFLLPPAILPAAMMLFRGMQGFGYAAANTAYSAAVADVTPRDRLALGFGVNWTAQGTAQLVGGVAVVALVWGDIYWPAFLCAALFCALGTAAAALCRYERPAPVRRARRAFRLSDILEPSALPQAAVVLIYYMNIAVGTFFTIPLAVERGIGNSGLFFTVCAFGMIASNLFLVKLAARFSRLATLLPVFAMAALCDLCLAAARSLPLLLAAGMLYGVSVGAMPVFQSATLDPLPLQRRGAATATLLLAMDLSMGLGPVLWGAVIDSFGFTAACLGGAAFACAAAAALVIVSLRKGGF